VPDRVSLTGRILGAGGAELSAVVSKAIGLGSVDCVCGGRLILFARSIRVVVSP